MTRLGKGQVTKELLRTFLPSQHSKTKENRTVMRPSDLVNTEYDRPKVLLHNGHDPRPPLVV